MEAMKDEFETWSAMDDQFYKFTSSDAALAAFIRRRIGSFARVVARP